MAVTSIWAVHRSIKDALDYAANPEKTENPNEEDLRRLMDYAENPDKTEQRYLISGVNCLPELAYERMMETKRRYGKYGGIVAYHGYMSFKPGEVTPEQCHALGVELAKRLWGDKYEVLVASHRDHEHLHNHFILNSVSFKDGEKFHCAPYYHDTVMAPASDKLCREHDLSVIQNPQRKRAPYVAYMAEKKGKPSHRTLLKMDIDDAIADCMLPTHLQFALARRGYTYLRGKEYKHPCVIAKGWKRPVRIDSLGERYTAEAIEKRILSKRGPRDLYRPQYPPLYEIWKRRKGYDQHNTVELIFMIVLELFGIDTSGKPLRNDNYQEPLSPAMRQEQIYLERYMETVNLINRNNIGTTEEVQEFINDKEAEMAMLLSARNKIDNRRRRATTEAEKDECSLKRKAISKELARILEQQEYCGDVINFKSYSKSFRNKTRIENPKENWAIFKDVHEPIIDRETWERVQELTKNTKRRKPKDENVKKSIFTNLLYCGDCGHKLWFNINKQNPSIRFYSCSNYKGIRGTCESTHYVREDSLEQVVKMELFKLATFLDHDETAFAELLEHKTNKDALAERKAAESALAAATARSQELLRLYERVYEDNVNGKVTDDWFMRLSHKYEVEQEELKKQMFELKEKIERLNAAQNSSGSFIRAIRKFMTMQILTPVVLQELIDKIEVFPIEGTGKNRTQRLVIHYRFVGCIDLPSIVPKHTYKLDSRQGVAIEYLPSAV